MKKILVIVFASFTLLSCSKAKYVCITEPAEYVIGVSYVMQVDKVSMTTRQLKKFIADNRERGYNTSCRVE